MITLREDRAIPEVIETFVAPVFTAEQMKDSPIEKSFFTGDSSETEVVLKGCWD